MTKVLASNIHLTGPVISPAVSLTGSGAWTLDGVLSCPVGTSLLFTVESSATQTGPWVEVARHSEEIIVATTIGKDGHTVIDMTIPAFSFSLNGDIGTWFRLNVLELSGATAIQVTNLTINSA